MLGKTLDSGQQSKVGEDISVTGVNADYLFLGHYHNPGQDGKVYYLGSTHHDDFNDAGKDKFIYYLEWDGTNIVVEKHSMMDVDVPHWVKVKNVEEITPELCKNNFIRIDTTVSLEDQDELLAKVVKNYGALYCEMKTKITKRKQLIEKVLNISGEDHKERILSAADQYMQHTGIPGELDKAAIETQIKKGCDELFK